MDPVVQLGLGEFWKMVKCSIPKIIDLNTYPPQRYSTVILTIRHQLNTYATDSKLVPCHTIPYHTILYHTIPYHTIPYHTCAKWSRRVVALRGAQQWFAEEPLVARLKRFSSNPSIVVNIIFAKLLEVHVLLRSVKMNFTICNLKKGHTYGNNSDQWYHWVNSSQT